MKLENLLAQKRATILGRWFDLIVETYPAETAKFLKRRQDQFANPVGAAVHEGIEGLLTQLATGLDPERISPFLDRIIRVRAIQDFTPSRAVAFVPLLKGIIREELEGELETLESTELAEFESRIDQLTLLAFDVYMACRERIYEIKVNEIKRMYCSPFDRKTLVCRVPEPDDKGGDAQTTEAR